MSEYQYYEFLAIDRRLTAAEINAVRRYSSRAEISAARFVNTYDYGDFRGEPDQFIEQWFDVMVYVTNWGTHQLLIGIPDGMMSKDASAFQCDELNIRSRGHRRLIDLRSEVEEGGAHEQGDEWMPLLAPIREELMSGDLRPLCLAWLSGLQFNKAARPVHLPCGLNELTPAQLSLSRYLRLGDDLLTAAKEKSPPLSATEDRLPEFIAALPAEEKEHLLLEVARGQGSDVGRGLMQRYQSVTNSPQHATAPCTRDELLQRAEVLRLQRQAAEREAADRRAAERAAQQRAQRQKYLEGLSTRQRETWREIEFVLDSKRQKEYAAIVAKLVHLRVIAVRENAINAFNHKLKLLREEHARKHLFIKQLNLAGIG